MESPLEDIERYRQPSSGYYEMYAHEPPDWLDQLNLKPAPPHHFMGMHTLDVDDWFVLDELRDAELSLRDRLLAERRDDVFAVLPSAEDAAVETQEMVRSWLSTRGLLGDLEGRVLDRHPLAAAGQLVQDDLCLMVRHDDGWRLDAAMLCFPAVWRLHEKLGHTTADVHAPVNHYGEELSAKVDRFFDRLTVGKPVWRRNLSLKPTHALYLPVSKRSVRSDRVEVHEDGSPYWLRSERQTLRKLPRTGAILFGIRTQLAPVSVLRMRPDRARDLVHMYDSWDQHMQDFKMADSDIKTSLMPWLRQLTESATP